ncbi:MAG: ABC transporter permease [Gaiellaceae bacterium]
MGTGAQLIRVLIRRVFWAVWLFLVVTLCTYVIFFLIPGSPLRITNQGLGLDAQLANRISRQLHLDVSVFQQYWIFVWNIVRHQSLGYSYHDGSSVRWIIGQDARVTGSLVLGGALLWLAIAFPIGIVSALRPRSLLDRSATAFVLIGISAPPVWLALILTYTFGFKLGWTPIADYCNFFPDGSGACSGPARWAYHLLLPWIAFTFIFAAIYVRMIRSTLLETMNEDYVRTAWAKGASRRRVVLHHVLRNSLLPVVTMLGMDLGIAMGGSVFIENVFSLHGLGQELLLATRNDDVPVVVGIVVFVGLAVIVCNFVVDLLYAWLDPRVRLRT